MATWSAPGWPTRAAAHDKDGAIRIQISIGLQNTRGGDLRRDATRRGGWGLDQWHGVVARHRRSCNLDHLTSDRTNLIDIYDDQQTVERLTMKYY